jgi:hypothetical protein
MPARAPRGGATAGDGPSSGALPLLRAATDPNARERRPRHPALGELESARAPTNARSHPEPGRDGHSTCWGASPGVLALALGGTPAQQDRAAVGLQADRLIGRSSAYRDARSASLEYAARRDGSVGWQAGRPAGHWASAPGWNRGALAKLVLNTVEWR